MSIFVNASNVGDAWLQAYRALLATPGRQIVNLAVSIAHPLQEDLGVRGALEQTLAELASKPKAATVHSVHTVANTIFPISLYRPDQPNAAKRFFERASTVSQLHNKRRHEWGTYIGRLIQYDQPDGAPVNQLERFLTLLKGDKNWADIYEAPLAYAGETSEAVITEVAASNLLIIGPDDRRTRGGPCLAHLSLTSLDGHLHMTALYRRHSYLARAYGNFLGLARLLNFLAHESGRQVGQLLVVGTHAEIESGTSAGTLQALADAATEARGAVHPIEVATRPLGAGWRDLDLPTTRVGAG